MKIIRHGHSFVEIQTDIGSYLVDPFITGNPKCDVTLEEISQKQILGIFLTHGHADHIGDTVEIYHATQAGIVGEYGLRDYFSQKHNINIIAGSLGGTIQCGEATIKFFNAPHGGGIMDNALAYKCMSTGLLITIDGKTFYHAGDTSLTYDMKLLGEYHKVDVACVPIGDIYTMGIEDGAIAVGFIKPKIAFPIHFDTWDKLKVDSEKRAQLVHQNTQSEAKILQPGEFVNL
ncbi:MAG TPA: metal-dependent hydrolase [Candidatus Absconditabacterales bacterium]|nr:metal-dependent hydrolase [Candidatus Absconditabacterales bacterium]HMT26809.1 metal-dependent hydrolase [Candidatus Absconditabacterales bacterium]